MGKPIRIIDLAMRMIRLSGMTVQNEENPEGDIAIKVVGLRPGEKLYEELLIGENVEGTSHPLIMRAYEHELPWPWLEERLSLLDVACQSFEYEKVLEMLAELVQEYAPVRHDDEHLLWKYMVGEKRCDAVVH